MNRKVELLIPAGSMEGLKTAIHYGADAVYMGGEAFGLRASAKNFTLEKMKEAVVYAHERGVKVYVTANILAHNEDLLPMREYFLELKDVGMDAVLVADPGAFMLAKEIMPEVELHISTQANNTNQGAYSGGDGNRSLCSWRHVYVLFRKMSAFELFYGKRCQSGGMHASLPLEIYPDGRKKTGRILSRF